MIEWPNDDKLDSTSLANVERFRQTAAALELEDDPETYALVSWARTEEPPARMMLRRKSDQRTLVFTMENTGTWTLQRRA